MVGHQVFGSATLESFLRGAASAEMGSQHPLASAVLAYCEGLLAHQTGLEMDCSAKDDEVGGLLRSHFGAHGDEEPCPPSRTPNLVGLQGCVGSACARSNTLHVVALRGNLRRRSLRPPPGSLVDCCASGRNVLDIVCTLSHQLGGVDALVTYTID